MKFKPLIAEVGTQTIYLDRQGTLHNSCDSLFSTKGWDRDDLLARFPLLRSIFAKLTNMPVGKHPIHIPRVEEVKGLPPGFYDFSFICLQLDGKDFIRWVIYDYTQKYRQLQNQQQEDNNIYLLKDRKILKS